jgi:hypothetical protein
MCGTLCLLDGARSQAGATTASNWWLAVGRLYNNLDTHFSPRFSFSINNNTLQTAFGSEMPRSLGFRTNNLRHGKSDTKSIPTKLHAVAPNHRAHAGTKRPREVPTWDG